MSGEINPGSEVRLCFEIVMYKSDVNHRNRRIPNFIIFYGDADKGQFTDIGIAENLGDSFYDEKWLCARPKTDTKNVRLIGLDNEDY